MKNHALGIDYDDDDLRFGNLFRIAINTVQYLNASTNCLSLCLTHVFYRKFLYLCHPVFKYRFLVAEVDIVDCLNSYK